MPNNSNRPQGRFSRSQFAAGSGFTLLEIVIAISIFGVIASIIFPALLQFLDMRERVDEKHQEVKGLQKTFLFLANDLRFAANRLSKDEYGELGKTTMIVNDSGLLDFTTVYPDLSLNGLNVPRRVRWQLEDGVLQRVQYPVMDPGSDTRIMLQSLLEGVERVDVNVSHIEEGRNNTDDKWDEQTRLPDAVEIVIELANNKKYKRIFTMLSADSKAATVASVAAQGGGSDSDSNQVSGGNQTPGSARRSANQDQTQ